MEILWLWHAPLCTRIVKPHLSRLGSIDLDPEGDILIRLVFFVTFVVSAFILSDGKHTNDDVL